MSRDSFEDSENFLNPGKNKYSMQKDEIVMNTSKKFHAACGHTAYPLVITTLGDLNISQRPLPSAVISRSESAHAPPGLPLLLWAPGLIFPTSSHASRFSIS